MGDTVLGAPLLRQVPAPLLLATPGVTALPAVVWLFALALQALHSARWARPCIGVDLVERLPRAAAWRLTPRCVGEIRVERFAAGAIQGHLEVARTAPPGPDRTASVPISLPKTRRRGRRNLDARQHSVDG
ncbi:MAG: hypothetical protein MUF16_04275 [Burkholderiaceae bacterium]|nr:hypothetical protein [Burkholderiaceae bacterium]